MVAVSTDGLDEPTSVRIGSLSEAVDPDDVAGDRHDVRRRADELDGRRPVEHELLAVRADDRGQLAVQPDDEQPARVRLGARSLPDTVPLTLGDRVEPAAGAAFDVDEHARPAGDLDRLPCRAHGSAILPV